MLRIQSKVKLFFLICVLTSFNSLAVCKEFSFDIKCNTIEFPLRHMNYYKQLIENINEKNYGCALYENLYKFYDSANEKQIGKIEKLIKKNDIEAAIEMYYKNPYMSNNLKNVLKEIYSSYTYNNLYEFLDSLKDIKETYYGYRILLNLILENDDLYYTTWSMTLLYRAQNLLNHNDNDVKELGESILKHYPILMRNIPFEKPVRIINTNRHILYASQQHTFGPERQEVYGWHMNKTHDFDESDIWYITSENNGLTFKIKNKKEQKFLYPEHGGYNTASRHRIFLWSGNSKSTKFFEFNFKYSIYNTFCFESTAYNALMKLEINRVEDVKNVGRPVFLDSYSCNEPEPQFFIEEINE